MSYLNWDTVQNGLSHRKAWVRALTIVGMCLAAGLPAGAIIGVLGALYGSAALIALVVGYLMLRSLLVGLFVLVGTICLFPFAALPVDVGFTPTFLDLVLLALFFVLVSRVVTRRDGEFIASSPTLWILVFLALAVVSFIVGLSHSSLTANIARHFGEILLSVLIFFVVINTVRTVDQLRTLMLALILGGTAAASIGVVLYFLPRDLTVRLLSLLRVVRYPTGLDVIRYIEDNPDLPLRATSTSIDPNVLGGMLIFVTGIAAPQVLASKPILPRRWLVPMLGMMGLCMILTFSRGSFGGLGVGLLLLGLLRYRRMLWLGLAGLIVMLIIPPAQVYVRHLVEGLRGQDLATQMRFGEYGDALILISRHPWFGVGFAGTPDIDTYLGVSNVYLLIAEEMGVLGLLAFVGALVAFLANFFSVRAQCDRDSELEPMLYGLSAAVAGAMVGGMLDHYLFNLNFPHAAALLWLVVGLGAVSIRLVGQQAQSAS